MAACGRRACAVHGLVHGLVHGVGQPVGMDESCNLAAGGASQSFGLGRCGRSIVIAWSDVVAWVARVPPGVWVAAMVANIVLTGADVVDGPNAGCGGRASGSPIRAWSSGEERAKDTALTVASLVPAGLFWVMVLAG